MPKPYPQEFRDDVVRVARGREPGVTVEQIAKDFGVHPMTLFKWLRQADADDGEYQGAPPAVRRQLNQGFFEKLYIAEDGSVEAVDLQQPFAALLTGSAEEHVSLGDSSEGRDDERSVSEETPSGESARLCETGEEIDRARPSAVFMAIWGGGNVRTPGHTVITRGSSVHVLAEDAGFEPARA